MCFKKLARVAVGAGVGFLTGGPIGAVAGGVGAAVTPGKSILGGAAIGAAGGFGTALVGSAAASGIGGKILPTLGKAALSSAGTSFGQPKGQAGGGAAAGLLASPTPVGAAVPVTGAAGGGIMTAPVAGTDEEQAGPNIAIRMAQDMNNSFNRALST